MSDQPANTAPPATGYEKSYASEPTDAEIVNAPAWEDNVFVWTLAISSDGRHIAAYAIERTPNMPQCLQLWDTVTGKTVREFEQPNRPNRVRFSADGTLVLGVGSILDEHKREVTENPAGELVVSFDTNSLREPGRKHIEFYNPENCQRIERLTPLRSID